MGRHRTVGAAVCAVAGYAAAIGWGFDGPGWLEPAALLLWFAAGFQVARFRSAIWVSVGGFLVLYVAGMVDTPTPTAANPEPKSIIVLVGYLPVVAVVTAIGSAFGQVASERWADRALRRSDS